MAMTTNRVLGGDASVSAVLDEERRPPSNFVGGLGPSMTTLDGVSPDVLRAFAPARYRANPMLYVAAAAAAFGVFFLWRKWKG